MKPVQTRGFTLIELLLAMSIFAVIALAATGLLEQMVATAERVEQRATVLAELQRAKHQISMDIRQLVHRDIRTGSGAHRAAIIGGQGGIALAFTRQNWRNPLQAARSNLQRVAYRYDNNQLFRLFWQVLDRAPDSAAHEARLLAGVRAFHVQFFTASGERALVWPWYGGIRNLDPAGVNTGVNRLVAIQITLEVEPFGEITWLLPVAPEQKAVLAGARVRQTTGRQASQALVGCMLASCVHPAIPGLRLGGNG